MSSNFVRNMGQVDAFGRVRNADASQTPLIDLDDLVSDKGFVAAREGAYKTTLRSGSEAHNVAHDVKLPFGIVFDVKNKPANFDDLPREVRQSMIDVVRIQAGRYGDSDEVGKHDSDDIGLPATEIEITRDEIKIRALGDRPIRMVAPAVIFQEKEDSRTLYRMRPTDFTMEFARLNRDIQNNPEQRWVLAKFNDTNTWTQIQFQNGSVNFQFSYTVPQTVDAKPAVAKIKTTTVGSEGGATSAVPALTFVWVHPVTHEEKPMDILMDTMALEREFGGALFTDLNTLMNSPAYEHMVGSGTTTDPFTNYMELVDADARYRFFPRQYQHDSDEQDGVFLAIFVKKNDENTWAPASLSLG